MIDRYVLCKGQGFWILVFGEFGVSFVIVVIVINCFFLSLLCNLDICDI